MAAEDSNDVSKTIRHGEYLTMVDTLRGQFHPITDRNDAGQVTYPRRDFLTSAAAARKAAADEEAKRGGG